MKSEAALQSIIRRDFAYIGPIWRNNSGACTDETGRLIRYGLGNDSAQLNERIKSSDLIGITPVQAYCTLWGVAAWRTVGVFTSFEIKPPGWHQTPGDKRAGAQGAFHGIVRDAGGFAGFVTDPADVARIIGR